MYIMGFSDTPNTMVPSIDVCDVPFIPKSNMAAVWYSSNMKLSIAICRHIVDGWMWCILWDSGFSDKMALSKHTGHIGEIVLNLKKSTACLPDKFPCQEVSYHPKPVVKPALPPDFKVVEETEHSNVADTPEFLVSFTRWCTQYSAYLGWFTRSNAVVPVADIMMAESDNFSDVHGMMGMSY